MKKKNIVLIISGVVIISIIVLAAFGSPIVNGMFSNTSDKACCTSNGGTWINDECEGLVDVSGFEECILK